MEEEWEEGEEWEEVEEEEEEEEEEEKEISFFGAAAYGMVAWGLGCCTCELCRYLTACGSLLRLVEVCF